jgi:hypothetical protein
MSRRIAIESGDCDVEGRIPRVRHAESAANASTSAVGAERRIVMNET